VGGDRRLALEHCHAQVGAACLQLARDGKPEDAGADDGEVGLAVDQIRSGERSETCQLSRAL